MSEESLIDLLVDRRVDDLLRRAPLAHLAIDTGKGPHVTPELFAWSGGRLWLATARRTLKSRRLTAGARVGLYMERGASALLLNAEARPLDALRPATLLASPPEVGLFFAAGATFLIRNAPHLAGLMVQGPAGWPRSPGTLRSFVGLRPRAAALLHDGRIAAAAGEWSYERPVGRRTRRGGRVRADELPSELAPLAEELVRDALIGVSSPSGPVVLPATWDGATAVATVRTELLTLAGVSGDGPAAVEVERMRGYAMENKKGVLLRGRGTVAHDGPFSTITIEPDRATFWEGLGTETVPASTT